MTTGNSKAAWILSESQVSLGYIVRQDCNNNKTKMDEFRLVFQEHLELISYLSKGLLKSMSSFSKNFRLYKIFSLVA